MALNIGDKAPDFTLPSTTGKDFTLSINLKDKPCILYFYPKDFSPVCTKEACSFQDNISVFNDMKIDVVGISKDSVEIHRKFQKEHSLTFELLADENGKVCAAYDALIPLVRMPKRITYLLNSKHEVVEVVNNMFSPSAHIQELIAHLKKEEVS